MQARIAHQRARDLVEHVRSLTSNVTAAPHPGWRVADGPPPARSARFRGLIDAVEDSCSARRQLKLLIDTLNDALDRREEDRAATAADPAARRRLDDSLRAALEEAMQRDADGAA